MSKSIVIRVGEPVPLSDLMNEFEQNLNTYFLNKTDLVFPCIICDYEDFTRNQFNDKIYISSWELVKEIDSNIYCKTELSGSIEGSTYVEEKWEEIDDLIFEKLCLYIKDVESNESWCFKNLISNIRDSKLKKLL